LHISTEVQADISKEYLAILHKDNCNRHVNIICLFNLLRPHSEKWGPIGVPVFVFYHIVLTNAALNEVKPV